MSIVLAALLAQASFTKSWEIEGFGIKEMLAFDDKVILFKSRTDVGNPAVRCFGMDDGKERWTYSWDPKWTDRAFTEPVFSGSLDDPLAVRMNGDRVSIVGARLVTMLEAESGTVVLEVKLDSQGAGNTMGELSAHGLHVTTMFEARLYDRAGKPSWTVKPGTRKIPKPDKKLATCDEVFGSQRVVGDVTVLVKWYMEKGRTLTLHRDAVLQIVDSTNGKSLDLPEIKGGGWGNAEGDFVLGTGEGTNLGYSISKRKQTFRLPAPKAKTGAAPPGSLSLLNGRTVHESEGKHYAMFTWNRGNVESAVTRVVDLDSGRIALEERLGRWAPEWVSDAGLLLSNSHEGVRLINLKDGRQMWKHVPKELAPDTERVVPIPFGGRGYYFAGFSSKPKSLVELDLKKGTVLREIVVPDTIRLEKTPPPRTVSGTNVLLFNGSRTTDGEAGPVILDTASGEFGTVHAGFAISPYWTPDGRRNLQLKNPGGIKAVISCMEVKPAP